jgi:hypothetical protein
MADTTPRNRLTRESDADQTVARMLYSLRSASVSAAMSGVGGATLEGDSLHLCA